MWPPPLPKLLFSSRKSFATAGQDGQNRERRRSQEIGEKSLGLSPVSYL